MEVELGHLVSLECPECPECPEPEPEPEPSQTTILVSNRELTWADLPALDTSGKEQDDNGSFTLVSTETRDDVPLIIYGTYPSGNKFIDHYEYATREVYIYEAEFDWNNYHFSFNLDNYNGNNEDGLSDDELGALSEEKKWRLDWLVDVERFANDQISCGDFAFAYIPAASLSALSELDTSNIESMMSMFTYSKNFNQPLDNFDTSNVTITAGMFSYAEAFNKPLNHLNVSKVTIMDQMFYHSTRFNQPLDNWDTSSVTGTLTPYGVKHMNDMFGHCKAFNKNISKWCVEEIKRKPGGFDLSAGPGFANQTAKQPQWGAAC